MPIPQGNTLQHGDVYIIVRRWTRELSILIQVITTMKKSKPTVFISYAREDQTTALEIYEFLKTNGCSVWIDIHELKPGQDWQLEIEKAIQSSKFFVACLSSDSVSKFGYVQKELKSALAIVDLMPEGRVYLLPIRLDACEVPHSLSGKQWLDWNTPNAKKKILEAMGIKTGSRAPKHVMPGLKPNKSAQPIVNREKLHAYAETLRNEIVSNLHILDEPIVKMGFLSDIRYVEFIKSGNIAYLPFVVFDKVIRSYNRLHQLNGHVLKCRNHDPEYKPDVAQACKSELAERLQELIDIFDTKLQGILDSFDYDEEENENNYLLYALRFEVETNKIWLEDIYTTLNYLRTDAWDVFRKNQNEVEIPHPVMDRLNAVYQKLYVINDFHINNLRNQSTNFDEQDAIRDKEVLIDQINIFIGLFDKYFPRISANFRK